MVQNTQENKETNIDEIKIVYVYHGIVSFYEHNEDIYNRLLKIANILFIFHNLSLVILMKVHSISRIHT